MIKSSRLMLTWSETTKVLNFSSNAPDSDNNLILDCDDMINVHKGTD
jgi:hypothetical protein